MVRKSMWAALAVLLAYAPGALAYQYRVSQSDTLMYAKELFGAGSLTSRISYGDITDNDMNDVQQPLLTLTIILTDGTEEDDVDVDDEMEIDISIAGGQFAQAIRAGDVKTYVHDDADNMDRDSLSAKKVNVNREDGGTAGTSSVSLVATATGTWSDSDSTNTAIEIVFELPPFRGLNGITPVTATVEVEAGGGSGFKSSDDDDVTVDDNTARSTSGGILRRAEAAGADGSRASVPLINFVRALSFNSGGGYRASIDLTGGRTAVNASTPFFLRGYAVLGWAGAGVISRNVRQLDGGTFSIATRQNGAGQLVISVTGQFHDSGDLVWLDLNKNWVADSGERLTLRDGVFSGRFNLIDVAGDRTATGDSDEQERLNEEGWNTSYLLYYPNGTDTLRPAQYTSAISVDFTDRRNVDYDGESSMLVNMQTNYTVVNPNATRQAYAIPPLGGSDMGNIRVKCETAVACPLYLECDDSAGESWFQRLSDSVASRSTLRLTSASIAEHLGVGEDGWEGRLSCSVMSTQTISVQVLTRSGGVLVNNTYIDN